MKEKRSQTYCASMSTKDLVFMKHLPMFAELGESRRHWPDRQVIEDSVLSEASSDAQCLRCQGKMKTVNPDFIIPKASLLRTSWIPSILPGNWRPFWRVHEGNTEFRAGQE